MRGSVLNLSAEWSNKFALVHQRLLVVAPKRDDWATVAKEVYRVIAPGGWVQLCQVDPVSSMEVNVHTRKFIGVFKELAGKSGIDLMCANSIPGVLDDAGFVDFTVIKRTTVMGPLGGELGARAGMNALDVWKGMKKPILSLGGLGDIRDEFDAMIDNIGQEWKEMPGGEFSWHMIAVRKPYL